LEDIAAYICHNDEVVILAFRGTEPFSAKEWAESLLLSLDSEAPFSNGRVHEGYQKSLNLIWDKICKVLQSVNLSKKKLYLTGHSLGGSLAYLAALRIHQHKEYSASLQAVMTFGQPKTGDQKYVNDYMQQMNGKTFRFENNKDLVPTLPNEIFPNGSLFKHAKDAVVLETPAWVRSECMKRRYCDGVNTVLNNLKVAVNSCFCGRSKVTLSFRVQRSIPKASLQLSRSLSELVEQLLFSCCKMWHEVDLLDFCTIVNIYRI
jgi:hypothetical protein